MSDKECQKKWLPINVFYRVRSHGILGDFLNFVSLMVIHSTYCTLNPTVIFRGFVWVKILKNLICRMFLTTFHTNLAPKFGSYKIYVTTLLNKIICYRMDFISSISFPNEPLISWTFLDHFCHPFWVGTTAKQQQTHDKNGQETHHLTHK